MLKLNLHLFCSAMLSNRGRQCLHLISIVNSSLEQAQEHGKRAEQRMG